jgi:hypothetical protein
MNIYPLKVTRIFKDGIAEIKIEQNDVSVYISIEQAHLVARMIRFVETVETDSRGKNGELIYAPIG